MPFNNIIAKRTQTVSAEIELSSLTSFFVLLTVWLRTLHKHKYAYTSLFSNACESECAHACRLLSEYVRLCVYIYIYVCVCVCVCVYEVYLESIETEAVFSPRQKCILNETLFSVFQNSFLAIQYTYSSKSSIGWSTLKIPLFI